MPTIRDHRRWIRRRNAHHVVLLLLLAACLVLPAASFGVSAQTLSRSLRATSSAPVAVALFSDTLVGTRHDLGTLVPGGVSTVADVGGNIVVGYATDANIDLHAFAYDLGATNPHMVDLGTLGGATSEATAISGHVVTGSSETANGETHAFAYELGATNPHMADLGTLGGPNSEATAISGHVIVGASSTANTVRHAFAYDLSAASPAMVDLGAIGFDSEATAVDGHVVVGSADTTSDNEGPAHAVAYDLASTPPRLRDLGTLSGGHWAQATDISDHLVVGISELTGGRFHAFAFDLSTAGATMRDLGDLGDGSSESGARAVDGPLVVGDASAGGPGNWAFAERLSASNPTMFSLGSLGGHLFDRAEDVDGKIVTGTASRVINRRPHAFAYDLGAANPRMTDLGPTNEDPIHLSGHVVAGTQLAEPGNRAVAWTLSTSPAPALRFSVLKTFVHEYQGRATITVVRDGDAGPAATIDYFTKGVTARGGSDYTPTAGTLSFAPGQTSASFRILITDDTRREGRESLLVRLHNPSVGAIRGTPVAGGVIILASDR